LRCAGNLCDKNRTFVGVIYTWSTIHQEALWG
jgi:hypothetical protein